MLVRALREVVNSGSPRSVHRLRTTCRRLEALAPAGEDAPGTKIRRRLRKLRSKSNRLRDLDVHIETLQRLQADSVAEEKNRLMGRLLQLRTRQHQRLCEYVLARHRKLRKHLRRFSAATPARAQPEAANLALALEIFAEISRTAGGSGPEDLHRFRIGCKRARYVAEMARESEAARGLVAELKRLQDALGDWHDWDLLRHTAQAILGVQDSPLLSALALESEARLARGLAIRQEVTSRLLAAPAAASARKPPAGVRAVRAHAS